MADEPRAPNQVPPQKVSVGDSKNAPVIFFDGVSNLGNFHGIVNLTLVSSRNLMSDGVVVSDIVAMAFLRCGIQGAIELRNAIDQALLLGAETKGQAN